MATAPTSSTWMDPSLQPKWGDYEDMAIFYCMFMGGLVVIALGTQLLSKLCKEQNLSQLSMKDLQAAARAATLMSKKQEGEENIETYNQKKPISWPKIDNLWQVADAYLSFVSIILWIIRVMARSASDGERLAEAILNLIFAVHWCYRLVRQRKDLTSFAFNPFNAIDAFTIIASLFAFFQMKQDDDTWLNFQFLRFFAVINRSPVKLLLTYLQFDELLVELFALLEKVFIVVIGFAATIYTFETLGEMGIFMPDSDSDYDWTFFSSVYFIFITLSTVGYGDMSPATALGRFSVVGFIVVGIVSFGTASAQLVELFLRMSQGRGKHRARHPFIIVSGQLSRVMLADFLDEVHSKDRLSHDEKGHSRQILVMIDPREPDSFMAGLKESIRDAPAARQLLFFVGSPTEVSDLERVQARNSLCEGIFVMGESDSTLVEDVNLIFGAISSKTFNPRVPVFLLVASSSNQRKLESVGKQLKGPDVVVFQEMFEMTMLGKNVVTPGYSTMFYHLVETKTDADDGLSSLPPPEDVSVLDHRGIPYIHNWDEEYIEGAGNDITMVTLFPHYCERPYHEVCYEVFEQHSVTLMGIVTKEGYLEVQPSRIIPKGAKALLVVQNFYQAHCVGKPDTGGGEKRNVETEFKASWQTYATSRQMRQRASSAFKSKVDRYTRKLTQRKKRESFDGFDLDKIQLEDEFPFLLESLRPNELERILRNHVVLICARSHLDSLRYFLHPIREAENLINDFREGTQPHRQSVIVIHDFELTEIDIKWLHAELMINDLYWLHGSAFSSQTLKKARIERASRVVIAGERFSDKSAHENDGATGSSVSAYPGADLVFVLSSVRKLLEQHQALHRVTVISQVPPSVTRFILDPRYDHDQPLPKTTGFAAGEIYSPDTARLSIISSFFSSAVGIMLNELSKPGRTFALQIPLKYFIKQGKYKGARNYGDLFQYLCTLGIAPIAVLRQNRHVREGDKHCCERVPDAIIANGHVYTSPVPFLVLAPEKSMELCLEDKIMFYDNCDYKAKELYSELLSGYFDDLNDQNVHGFDTKEYYREEEEEEEEETTSLRIVQEEETNKHIVHDQLEMTEMKSVNE